MTKMKVTCSSLLLIALFCGFSAAEEAPMPERILDAAPPKNSETKREKVYLSVDGMC